MRQRSFYFSDGQYLQLLQSLCHDLTKPEAFVQLMGSAKSGKSALCETLTLYLLRKGHDVVYIDYPIESPEMLRSVLAQKFNLPTTSNVARQLEDTFLKTFEKPKLLIFDDSHQLSDITLLEIHRMADIQTGSKRVLNVLLCGEPELDERLLNKKELKSLLLNVSQKYLLQPMDKETLSQFFFSYIARTDSVGLQLSEDGLDLLYRSSKGYPGPATLLVELIAQSNAGNVGQKVVTKLELAEQIKSSDIQQALPVAELFNVNQLKVLGPIAAVFTIAAVGFMFQMLNDGDEGGAPLNQVSLQPTDSESPFSASNTITFTPQIVTGDNIAAEADSRIVALAGSGAAINSMLDSAQNTSQILSQELTPVQPIPSLLRPASVFSLDDEEYEEPISDSSLALVTAAEIGLAEDIIVEPEFEEFARDQSASASIEPRPENLNQSSLPPDTLFSEADVSLYVPVFAGAGLPENLVVTEGESQNDAPLATEEVAQIEGQTAVQAEEGVAQEIDQPLAIQLAEQLVRQVEEPLLQEAIPPGDASPNKVLDEESAAAVPEIAEATAAIQNITPVEAELDLGLSAEEKVRARVDSWVSAWEQQQLEGYFSSYSSEFEPRYESSVTRWRASRTRVIGNAQWIRLTLNEYEVIEERQNSIEVHFWLDYESPTYSDSTKKKLVLNNESGDWTILEEINLQVRS